jgi:hypothetical protein
MRVDGHLNLLMSSNSTPTLFPDCRRHHVWPRTHAGDTPTETVRIAKDTLFPAEFLAPSLAICGACGGIREQPTTVPWYFRVEKSSLEGSHDHDHHFNRDLSSGKGASELCT